MTTERFDIEIQDKVAKSIRTEIKGIGVEARATYGSLKQMRGELDTLGSSFSSTRSSSAGTTRAFREQTIAANAAAEASAKQRKESETLTRALQAQAKAARDLASVKAPQAQPFTAPSGGGGRRGGGKTVKEDIEELGVSARLTSQHLANLGFQLNDIFVSLASGQKPLTVFVQQGAQIAQISTQSGVSLGGMAKAAGGLLVRALTSVAGISAVVVGALGTVVYATAAGSAEFAKLENQLTITGNRAGLTARELYDMAETIADTNRRSVSSIRSIAEAYATNGNFSRRAIEDLTSATDKFARLTGQSSEDVISRWSEMTRGPTDFAVKLAESYNLLSAAQVDQIRTLEEQGQKMAATDALAAALNGTLKDQTVNLGYLERAWYGVSAAISNAWDSLKQWGAAEQTRPWSKVVTDLEKEIAERKKRNFGIAGNQSIWNIVTGGKAANDEAIKQAERQLDTAKQWAAVEARRRKATTDAANVQRDGIAAQARVVSLSEGVADNQERASRAIKAYRSDVEAMRRAGLDVPTAAQMAQVEKKITERYVPSTRGKPKKHGKTEEERLAERQAKTLKEISADLEREADTIARNSVGITVAIEDRVDRISDVLDNLGLSLKDAKGNWTEYGLAVVKTVTANELARKSLNDLRNAYSSVFDAAIQPADDWAAAQAAAALMLKDPDVEPERVATWLAAQKEQYMQATNPLLSYSRAMQEQTQLLKYHGAELEIQTEIRRRYNEMVAADPALRDTLDPKSLRDEVQQDRLRRQKQDFLSDLESEGMQGRGVGSNEWIIENYRDLYEQIEDMRRGDLASEERANAAKIALDRRYINARLDGATKMLDQLAQLQMSKNRTIAAIGKAAAIMQATIDGYRAVQAALAGPPGPPWSFAIAAATGAITVANVARIAGVGGFRQGGFTGRGMDHERAGDVHRNEFVFDASATRRIGVPALEAMRRGAGMPQAAGNDNGRARAAIRIVQGPGTYVEAVERSDGEIEIIAERIARRVAPDAVAKDISRSPNSPTSKAVARNYGLVRER